MRIIDFVREDLIIPELRSQEKGELIRELAEFEKTTVLAPSARSLSMFDGESSMYRSAPTAVFCCIKQRSQ